MKSLKQRIALLLSTVALLLAAGPFAGLAHAAVNGNSVTNNSNSLRVSPLRTDITVKPGTSRVVTVELTNLSKGTASFQPIENDFIAGDEKGTPSIILNQNSYAPTHSLKRFMVPIKQNITVAGGATKAVKLTLKVPITAQAGGYFGALRFAPAGTANLPVNVSSSVASLILMTVPGPTVEKLALTNFDVQQNGNTSNNFRTPDNLQLFIRFKNEGNLQEAPFGQIQVLKGKKLLYKYDFNQTDPKDEILPDSARRWEVPLKGMGTFGKYTVSGTLGYGKGQTIQVSKTVWIIPTSYILGAILVIVGLILLILIIRWFLRSYKRRVLRSPYRRR